MTLLGRLFEGRASVENPARPLTDASLLEVMGGASNETGVSVTPKGSLALSSVWRATNLLAGTIAGLPLHARDGERREVDVPALRSPHPDWTSFELAEMRMVHLLLWGNSYAQKVRNGAGQVVELWPLDPSQVKVGKAKVTDANRSGKVFRLGADDRAYTPYDVLHIPGLGYDGLTGVSPVRLGSQSHGLGLAGEKYAAKLFGNGALLSGVLQTEQRLEQDQADRLKANWRARMGGLTGAHEVAVLDSGAKFQPLGMPPADAQMLESRKFQVSEVARWFGVPPHMIGDVEKSTSWGTGIEQQSLGFVVYTLRPWLVRIEQRLNREVVRPADRRVYVKHKVEGLLRADSAGRAEFYRTMREIGVFSANDIRDLEDLTPVDGGDTYLQPLNMAPLGSESAPTTDGAP